MAPNAASPDAPAGEASPCAARLDPELEDAPYTNGLTALALAEALRRAALHRELPTERQFPNTAWADLAAMLYGAAASALFPGLAWGGLSADTAIYIQAGVADALEAAGNFSRRRNRSSDRNRRPAGSRGEPSGARSSSDDALVAMDAATDGQWRVFSKLGAGCQAPDGAKASCTGATAGQIITVGYGCVPPFAEQGDGADPTGGRGWEFAIAARASVAGDVSLEAADAKLAAAVSAALVAMAMGALG
jgi:hypothetical protein